MAAVLSRGDELNTDPCTLARSDLCASMWFTYIQMGVDDIDIIHKGQVYYAGLTTGTSRALKAVVPSRSSYSWQANSLWCSVTDICLIQVVQQILINDRLKRGGINGVASYIGTRKIYKIWRCRFTVLNILIKCRPDLQFEWNDN